MVFACLKGRKDQVKFDSGDRDILRSTSSHLRSLTHAHAKFLSESRAFYKNGDKFGWVKFCTMRYVCMYVCMYVYMYACMRACVHACMHVCMFVYVCMYVCVNVYPYRSAIQTLMALMYNW